MAWTLAEDSAATLRDRFPWATTVVSAEIKAESFHDHLQKEIGEFPAEFLLFLPVAVSLTLDTGGDAEPRRELRREPVGQDVILHDGSSDVRLGFCNEIYGKKIVQRAEFS